MKPKTNKTNKSMQSIHQNSIRKIVERIYSLEGNDKMHSIYSGLAEKQTEIENV